MPKDKVAAAIKRAEGRDAEDYAELVYEGYAPHGVAVLIETATDNPTRTVANVRMYFNKGNGNMGATGSVAFMFTRMGVFTLSPEGVDAEEVELTLIDHGLEELEPGENDKGEPVLVARCAFEAFGELQTGIEEMGITVISAESEYVPANTVELGETETDEVLALIDKIEQDDDVQKVFHNLA
jgi:YebC/PmpR family DNA-binding regulatory protein